MSTQNIDLSSWDTLYSTEWYSRITDDWRIGMDDGRHFIEVPYGHFPRGTEEKIEYYNSLVHFKLVQPLRSGVPMDLPINANKWRRSEQSNDVRLADNSVSKSGNI
jgi:hypothetical protein